MHRLGQCQIALGGIGLQMAEQCQVNGIERDFGVHAGVWHVDEGVLI